MYIYQKRFKLFFSIVIPVYITEFFFILVSFAFYLTIANLSTLHIKEVYTPPPLHIKEMYFPPHIKGMYPPPIKDVYFTAYNGGVPPPSSPHMKGMGGGVFPLHIKISRSVLPLHIKVYPPCISRRCIPHPSPHMKGVYSPCIFRYQGGVFPLHIF